jgi:hypothetical protein
MAETKGVYSLDDLNAVRDASAASFGLDRVQATLQAQAAYDRAQINQALADLAHPVTTQSLVWGGGGNIAMEEVDEYGRPLPGHLTQGITAQFPLREFKQALGWTADFFERATPADMAAQYIALRKGYTHALQVWLKKSLYAVGGNYSFVDRLTNKVTLAVKCLINADSTVLPDSPAGATFDGASHDHLDGEASLTAAFVDALILDVTEHGNTKGLKIYISKTDRAAFEALYSAVAGDRFVPLSLPMLSYGSTLSTTVKLETQDTEDVLIGYWKPLMVEVWVKPWAIANYVVCAATGMPEKVLGYRQPAQPGLQGWRIAAQFSDHPLIAEYAKAEFGFGVYNRTMAAVLYFANATYAAPTIT